MVRKDKTPMKHFSTRASLFLITLCGIVITNAASAQEADNVERTQTPEAQEAACQTKAAARSIAAYPVPFTDFLHVDLKGYNGHNITVELVHNNMGAPLLSQTGIYLGQSWKLDTSALPDGFYALVIRSRGVFMGSREVLKAKIH